MNEHEHVFEFHLNFKFSNDFCQFLLQCMLGYLNLKDEQEQQQNCCIFPHNFESLQYNTIKFIIPESRLSI